MKTRESPSTQLTLALAVREAKQGPRWWDLAAKAAAP